MATIASVVVAEAPHPTAAHSLAWLVGESADGGTTFDLVPVFDSGRGWRLVLEGSRS